MHKHIEWDVPGSESVDSHYANTSQPRVEPHPGMILTARYKGATARIKVEAYKDGVSIGSVAALIDEAGKRHDSHAGLDIGDMVRLPDDKRAFQAPPKKQE